LAHNSAQPGAGRLQLRCSAGHSSAARSSPQPGSSLQSAAIQRERSRSSAVGCGWLAGAAPGVEADGGRAGGGAIVEQAASRPRIAAAVHLETGAMGVILLEALAALLLLLFIVWWTMFSGRKGGERRDDEDDTGQP
jgi:hypothetical protein